MSKVIQALILVVIGGAVGAGGLAAASSSIDSQQEPAPVAPQTAPPAAEQVAIAQAQVEEPKAEAVEVSYRTTGSIHAGDAAFGLFTVSANEDVASVRLTVNPSAGARAMQALLHESTAHGGTVRVNVGDLAAGEEREVIVPFSMTRDGAQLTVSAGYSDLHGKSQEVKLGGSDHTIAADLTDRDAYAAVRRASSELALAEAEELKEAKNYGEALDIVRDARATNLEVGMAMRITNRFNDVQADLQHLENELIELSKPKPKKRVKPKPKRKIIIETGV